MDYTYKFIFVVKLLSRRNIRSFSDEKNHWINKIDVLRAIFHRFLDESFYIMQSTILKDGITRISILKYKLSGMKETPHVWYQILTDFLWKLDFHKTEANHGLLTSEDKTVLDVIYLIDWLLFAADVDLSMDNVI